MAEAACVQPARILLAIPTLGERPELLALTLESITSQVGERSDVVVVVPAAATEARALARAAGAEVVDDPGGISAAVNAGWARATTAHSYLNWIGDDDLLAPGSLHAAASALDADESAVVAFGRCDYIDEEGRFLFSSRAGRLAPWLMTWGPDLVPQPGALFRRSAVMAVGGVDDGLNYAMDLDLLLRLRRMGRFVNTGQTLASFRWHPTSTTVANRNPSLHEAETVKRRYLSTWTRPLAPLWERPVRLSTKLAVRRVNRLAARIYSAASASA